MNIFSWAFLKYVLVAEIRSVRHMGICVPCEMAIHKFILEAHRGRTGLCHGIPLYVPTKLAIRGILVVVDSIGAGENVRVFGVVGVVMIMLATVVNDRTVNMFS